MKETNHDYQDCLVGNFYDNGCTSIFKTWSDFKNNFLAFDDDGYDDTHHFVFRYDIHKKENVYELELCIMLQRKGIYIHVFIDNITQQCLDNEVKKWLQGRYGYMQRLWQEVAD